MSYDVTQIQNSFLFPFFFHKLKKHKGDAFFHYICIFFFQAYLSTYLFSISYFSYFVKIFSFQFPFHFPRFFSLFFKFSVLLFLSLFFAFLATPLLFIYLFRFIFNNNLIILFLYRLIYFNHAQKF